MNRLLKVADPGVNLPQIDQRRPQVDVKLRPIRRQPDRVAVAFDRRLTTPERPERLREVRVRVRRLRPNRHRPTDQRRRLIRIPPLQRHQPQKPERLRLIRLLRQHRFINPSRPIQVPPTMQLQALAQVDGHAMFPLQSR